MADFRKLKVWQKAHTLMLDIHRLTRDIKGAPYISLRSQLIRAALSIPANIVEGRAQRTDKAFSQFLGYAKSSSSELEYHLVVALDMGVSPANRTKRLIQRVIQVRKMIIALQKKTGRRDWLKTRGSCAGVLAALSHSARARSFFTPSMLILKLEAPSPSQYAHSPFFFSGVQEVLHLD